MSETSRRMSITFDEPATVPEHAQPFQRLRVLSSSESGIHYVRDAKNNVLRRLTDEELLDLQDPKPCESCGEQFGCEHYNLAGEATLSDDELESAVPAQWLSFARSEGLSREDLARLRSISRNEDEGQFIFNGKDEHDLRSLEILLLLNESH